MIYMILPAEDLACEPEWDESFSHVIINMGEIKNTRKTKGPKKYIRCYSSLVNQAVRSINSPLPLLVSVTIKLKAVQNQRKP